MEAHYALQSFNACEPVVYDNLLTVEKIIKQLGES